MAATAGAAVLSLAFWAVAARLYSPTDVGGAAAQVAAINLLASVAQLNLMTILPRLLPVAGLRTPSLLRLSYLGVLAAAAIAGMWAFLSGGLSEFGHLSVSDLVILVACIVVFALFAVQDGVLTAFGRARWVPVVKAGVSLLKLSMLWALIGTGMRYAIIASWVLPTTVAVVVVSGFVAWLGRGVRNTAPSRLPPPRQLRTFVSVEYLNNLLSGVSVYLPPLLVQAQLDAAANAYFNIPWLVVLTTQTVLWSSVLSLVAESGRSPEQLVSHFRRILQIGGLVIGASLLVLLAAAPFALGLQGPDYARYGTPLLRLLALSLPFTGVVILYSATVVIEGKVWKLAAVNAPGAVVLTTGTWVLLPHLGISAVGWVYLGVQIGTAMGALTLLRRESRHATASRALHEAISSLRTRRSSSAG